MITPDRLRNEVNKRQTFQNAIDTYNRDLSENKRTIVEASEYLQKLTDKKVNRVLNSKTLPDAFMDFFKDVYNTEVDEVKTDITQSESIVKRSEEGLETYNMHLKSLNEKIANIEKKYPIVKLTDEAFRDALKGFPNINVDKCFISKTSQNDVVVHFYYHGVRCTPDFTGYKNIVDRSFEVEPIHVSMNLRSGAIKMYGDEYEVIKPQPRGFTQERVHPHIMSNHSPCLGGFVGAIDDAREECDIIQLATVIQMFLEQANNGDDAGAYFPRWMFANAKGAEAPGVYNRMQRISLPGGGVAYGIVRTGVSGNHEYQLPFLKDGIVKMLRGSGKIDKNGKVNIQNVLAEAKNPSKKKPAVKKKAAPKKKAVQRVVDPDVLEELIQDLND